ncbi:hypothetical protein [Aurantiacibacter sp. MUD61]|uniref:hypothetical protein n=1 Tax=Aurantiacibacter sp. MUD61 TaxID=3009083 RepID=UPI0022F071D4|nr:hypothetical protein [Aurantiacibacter sp. MUD61]
MRNKSLIALAASALALSGCANTYGGNPLGDLLGGILGGSGGYNDRNLSDFQRAAVRECGQEASRIGRVQITDVRQDDRDIVVVYGRIDTRDSRRDEFACAFRSDGRIVEFDLG